MFQPDLKQFLKLSKKNNVIPVYSEIFSDTETPVSVFLKVCAGSQYSYLLESVEGQEKIGRYSFLGASPSLIFTSKGSKVYISVDGHKTEVKVEKDPLDTLRCLMKEYKPAIIDGLPRFFGGMVGYASYDMVRFFEKIPDKNPDCLGFPESVFLFTDTLIIFDHIQHSIKVVSNVIVGDDPKNSYNIACSKIDQIIKKIRSEISVDNPSGFDFSGRSPDNKVKIRSNLSEDQFKDMVKKAKQYIMKGDIIQTVLSQRLEVEINADPFNVYRTLRRVNPSPYMYFLKLGGFEIVGSSPEMFLRVEDGIATVRPIAGTRKRGKDTAEDKKLALELLDDVKETAEHVMLVDLARNDLGRVCEPGSISLSEKMRIEKYSHVMHIVSEVKGKLKKKMDCFDCVRACFPAGTVSGAPKIRAMEIIDELENEKRGPYAGLVGYFSFNGNTDTCITIRTILMKGNKAYIQAGAGIVADSKPQNEYKETINKAKAMLETLKIARNLKDG